MAYTASTVPYHVAETREPIKLSRAIPDSRFPDWIPNEVLKHLSHTTSREFRRF